MTPFVELKVSPGGKFVAVKRSGVFASVTVKLKGCPTNPTALKALVTTAGAFELLPFKLFVGYKRLDGMICRDWSALYQSKCACALPLGWRYPRLIRHPVTSYAAIGL